MTTNTHRGKTKDVYNEEVHSEKLDRDVVFSVRVSGNKSSIAEDKFNTNVFNPDVMLCCGVHTSKQNEWGNGVISFSEVFTSEVNVGEDHPPLRTYKTKLGHTVKEVIKTEEQYDTGDLDFMTAVSKPFKRRKTTFVCEIEPKELLKYINTL